MTAEKHPQLELVHFLADGELDEQESKTLRDHLAVCTTCQRELGEILQLKALEILPKRVVQPRPRLVPQTELHEPQGLDTPAALRLVQPPAARPWSRRSGFVPLALAASLLLALGALAVRMQREAQQARAELAQARVSEQETRELLAVEEGSLTRERGARLGAEAELARLRRPQVGLPVFALNRTPGAQPGLETLRVAPDAQWVLISLEREDPPRFETYRAALLSADGKIVWQDQAIRPSSREQVGLAFHASALPPGDYSLRFEGVGKAQAQAQHAQLRGRSAFRVVHER